jgi:hypothetical protein
MDHSDFNIMLRSAYRERCPIRRSVRLPSNRDIRFGGDTRCATLFLSMEAVQANMQDDAAAFEGWSVVLMEWCGVQRVVVDWDEPTNIANGHYQRFLYRLRHFEALFGQEVVHIARPERLALSRIGNGSVATLNVAGGGDTVRSPSLPGSEADLEKRLAGANPTERARLMTALGLVELDRQMPVGVFDGRPSRAGAIFTGGKSAIDLIGLDRDGALWMLELKTARNIKVGALSELFFYSMVLLDARHGRLSFSSMPAGPRSTITPAHIGAAARVHARLLAEAPHPLLSDALFARLTSAAVSRGWAVDYGFLDLGPYLDEGLATESVTG